MTLQVRMLANSCNLCVNDFSKLKYTGICHAVICNERGQILTDGVVLRIAEDRYRTYWLSPVLQYLVERSELDVHGEDMTGQEYFIQVQGEKSLEILEDAFQADLHDIRFARHRITNMQGHDVRVLRLGMSGNLAYEIHGPMSDYQYVYNKVWESGQKFGARRRGNHAYNLFNHTEAGFPNIALHYPLPYFESNEDMTAWMWEHPMQSGGMMNLKLTGSVGDDLQTRFMTPFDIGWDFLVKFNHDFMGRKALEKVAAGEVPRRTCVTLEWNAEDVGAVFAASVTPGDEPVDDIARESDFYMNDFVFSHEMEFRADKVADESGNTVGLSSGRIRSYAYNSVISLGFVDPAVAEEGKELTVLWGTPGTKQMKVRVKVAAFPYNGDLIRNENRDVKDVPRRF